MYLLVDTMTDYKSLMTYEELKEFLINEVMQDLRTNVGDCTLEKEMQKNLNILERFLKGEDLPVEFNYVKKHLEERCYKVIDLEKLTRDIEDFKDYVATPREEKQFDVVLERIRKEFI